MFASMLGTMVLLILAGLISFGIIAAMVAAAGYFRYALGYTDGMEIDILPTWPLS